MAQTLDAVKTAGPATGPATPAERVARRKSLLNWIAVHALGVAAALFFVLPFVFLLLTSLMSDQQALTRDLWPHPFEWSNYRRVFETDGFLTWWRNTLLYAGLGTVLTVVSSLPVAYALAKFRFRGRHLSLMLVISMMMLPPQVVVIPMYLFWAKQLDMSGTLWPLIIPMAFGDAFSIFLLRQFLLTIPDEYLDAAKVDGCGEFRTLMRVVVPMAKPGIAAVALFQFFYAWNDYFGPQIYASENPAAWTLSYGLDSFKSAHHTDWNLTMAATVLVMAPVILVFFFAQKAFVEGVTLTGVKG
ncbi:carbohydrate ABC transporter permease [Streptomyces sp. NBC_01005]|uniref:carbohydrate ABC transporter permease n=1 Tax=Streptomyces TaxID=1883 RepID=UPI002251D75D|nr:MULTISPECIES: carbohydrate ABC transporter permease [unclassified Streptomyces]WSW07821.1 carbohydrate ABC transporter permease [Streptomyces sp. NBC_01005]WTB54365.1 carbohydrate ABC transporter permease [Streptomyces sp. NBC_00826]WTC97331.1 carbohydrate ABC transporter permease [Streptomyces sp. NBC_01650]WTH92746.1 carbohydrate ABC transporter permease [Streptomyces sp. NBC_00825]WTI01477.1 carbohydrate ABC transporter permease [Streptomyces sp. NBC_00822]